MEDRSVVQDGERLTRRRLLECAAGMVGGLLLAPLLAMARGEPGREWRQADHAAAWSPEQQALIVDLAETILPETQTAGATTAHVGDFIAHVLTGWFTARERERFLVELDEFAARCIAATGSHFTALSAAARAAYLAPLDREAAEARSRKLAPLPFFATLKELTLVGYYTSEVGAAAIGYGGPVGARIGVQGPICGRIWN
jgi:hypothetical protein